MARGGIAYFGSGFVHRERRLRCKCRRDRWLRLFWRDLSTANRRLGLCQLAGKPKRQKSEKHQHQDGRRVSCGRANDSDSEQSRTASAVSDDQSCEEKDEKNHADRGEEDHDGNEETNHSLVLNQADSNRYCVIIGIPPLHKRFGITEKLSRRLPPAPDQHPTPDPYTATGRVSSRYHGRRGAPGDCLSRGPVLCASR
jgi:hypothetical protein